MSNPYFPNHFPNHIFKTYFFWKKHMVQPKYARQTNHYGVNQEITTKPRWNCALLTRGRPWAAPSIWACCSLPILLSSCSAYLLLLAAASAKIFFTGSSSLRRKLFSPHSTVWWPFVCLLTPDYIQIKACQSFTSNCSSDCYHNIEAECGIPRNIQSITLRLFRWNLL